MVNNMCIVASIADFYTKICVAVANICRFRWILAVLGGCLAILVWLMPNAAAAAEVSVTAKAALLLDAQTGQVLQEKQGYTQLPPASTTKILTALLALDICPLDRQAVVSAAAAAVGESNVGLVAGEEFAVSQLLNAALLKSANDACYAIAEAAVGSEPLFVRLMNLKADALGAGAAVLLNTNGLPADGHTMSCYDLALLARAAMQNSEFSTRVGSVYGKMEGGSYNRSLKNTNKLLGINPNVTGIKTGTTNAAGACLVSSMAADGRSVIAVVLNSADRYGDSLKLLNSGINDYVNILLIKRGTRLGSIYVPKSKTQVAVCAAADVWVTLPRDFAPADLSVQWAWRTLGKRDKVVSGDVVGSVGVYYAGGLVSVIGLEVQ